MPTKEEEFKQRFAAVLLDLTENGQKDPEALWLIGSLACELTERTGHAKWAVFKREMTRQTYDQLLDDFQREGNRQHQEGDPKKAFAIQVLGLSLVARTQTDPEMRQGDALLDQMIETTMTVFRANRPPKPPVN
jgi:hypothetical protein